MHLVVVTHEDYHTGLWNHYDKLACQKGRNHLMRVESRGATALLRLGHD